MADSLEEAAIEQPGLITKAILPNSTEEAMETETIVAAEVQRDEKNVLEDAAGQYGENFANFIFAATEVKKENVLQNGDAIVLDDAVADGQEEQNVLDDGIKDEVIIHGQEQQIIELDDIKDDVIMTNQEERNIEYDDIKPASSIQEFIQNQDPLNVSPPEIFQHVHESIRRAEREFRETFFETAAPKADPTVRKNTRPVPPAAYLPNRNQDSSTMYQDSDGKQYSFSEGSPITRAPTLPASCERSQKRMKKTGSLTSKSLGKSCNDQLSRGSSSSTRQVMLMPERPVQVEEKHFVILKSGAFTAEKIESVKRMTSFDGKLDSYGFVGPRVTIQKQFKESAEAARAYYDYSKEFYWNGCVVLAELTNKPEMTTQKRKYTQENSRREVEQG